ncbi:IS1595 family transposase ISBsp8 [Paenibacillus plantiphilus]|uniref:IS1595 family transposase ISBsp8 n=1 Tax=Paenibacillus plantiphilus TaxID=2905650 RepID=A0ABM9C9N6_9BACL|nr:DUF5680 domain-containing protein [Paenibacillus plantiphilus]CAH1208108.1 IS1595 family transposase ISBsp8 [Paenibacillus plantiphilus]
MSTNYELLTHFLVEAKRSTYASQGDEASVQPLLNGSKQLEYESGDYFYRDIYFGSAFFIGQETVALENRPIWSMVYSGGIIHPNASWDFIAPVYGFLRKALMLVDTDSIYRGPHRYVDNNYVFENEYEGTLDDFYGKEIILLDGQKIYELRYNGGMIR